jgi:hypothetical protein
MNLKRLVKRAADKTRFQRLEDYIEFARAFLEYTGDHLQAVIVSRNEPHYNFWQYRQEGSFKTTRPINSNLMFAASDAEQFDGRFLDLIAALRESASDTPANRECVNRTVYTLQQCIGAALDALPGTSNAARKIAGDLFERLISLLLVRLGINCTSGTVKVPFSVAGSIEEMSFQHDLIIQEGELVKAIGSVKTSSKDRLGKIFVDKYLFNRLKGVPIPHFAIFLNDVQKKGIAPAFAINSTFLSGHFKGYSITLNSLDGVYYCDIRPNMRIEPFLRNHIKTFDHFVFGDVRTLLNRAATPADVEPEGTGNND